jgi:hypothetical protein
VDRQEVNKNGMSTRGDLACRPKEIGKTILTQKTCVSDAIHLWNQAPKIIKESNSVYKAKKRDKSLCQATASLIDSRISNFKF